MTLRRAILVAAALGCSRTLPPEPTQANLYRDMERIVTLAETAGWYIDRIELEKLLPAALYSVCQVEPPQRQALLKWIDARVIDLGGPVEKAYVARGRDLDAVDKLLELTRIRIALQAAIDAAPSDCPFWLEPQRGFRGRQISDDRWQLSFGGGGKGIVSVREGEADINFGGAGRVMFGRTFGDRWSSLVGVEAGASAAFPRDENGEGRGNLVFGFDVVVPAVVRYRMVSSYLEFEAGYLAHFTEDQPDATPGVRLGIAMGGRATRTRWFFPGAVFGISYERTFPTAPEPPLSLIKLGFRVAIDVDL